MKTMQKMLIGGHLVGADQWLEVLDPYSAEPLDYVARGTALQVDQAVAIAQHGANLMRAMSLSQREHILRQVAHLIRQEHEALTTLLVRETGKRLAEARAEVERAITLFELAAEACHHPRATQFSPDSFSDGISRFGFWAREPRGVVASILAFNLPLVSAAQKTAPAIAAGNAIILKPSTDAPLTCLRLGLLLYRAGLPTEALSILTGRGDEIGQALAKHEQVDLLTFTGSREVGLKLPVSAGSKQIWMELESVGAVVLTSSANLERVAEKVACCGFLMAGQSATAIQHVWVPTNLRQPLLDHLLPRLQSLKMGDPMDEETTLGPLINPQALERVSHWVQEAIESGAKVLLGAQAEPPFYHPTVLEEVPTTCTLYREAVFGPVILIHTYESLSDLIPVLNAMEPGLHLGLFTRDLHEAFQVARRVRALSVHINEVPLAPTDPIIKGDLQEHHMCLEDMRSRIEQMSIPKYVVFSAMD
ncbi:MAG: aldehyde dehydrogenase family protein [Fimbriimonadales bacterium]